MLFRRRRPEPLAEAAHMGFRSRLVLAKLGFDLRAQYDELASEPPEDIAVLIRQLDRNVLRLPR
jgi:hypothetical protein